MATFDSVLERTKTAHPLAVRGGDIYRIAPTEDYAPADYKKQIHDLKKKIAALTSEKNAAQAAARAAGADNLRSLEAKVQRAEEQARAQVQQAQAEVRQAQAQVQQAQAEVQRAKEAQIAAQEQAKTEVEQAQAEAQQAKTEAQRARSQAEVQQAAVKKMEEDHTHAQGRLGKILKRMQDLQVTRLAGGSLSEEAILGSLTSAAHGDRATVALDAMRRTLTSLDRHADLVAMIEAHMEAAKTTAQPPREPQGAAKVTYEAPVVVGLVPIVERLLDRYEHARLANDKEAATVARAEFEAAILEATKIHFALSPRSWEK